MTLQPGTRRSEAFDSRRLSGIATDLSPSTLQRLESVARLDKIASLSSSQRLVSMFAGTQRGRLSSVSSVSSASANTLTKEAAALLASFAPYSLEAFRKAQRQKHDRLKPEVVEDKLADMRKRVVHSYEAIAPMYASIISRCSKSSQQHNDQLFFESLYTAIAEVVIDVLGSKHRQQVQLEVGRVFKTPSFNSYARALVGPRSRDTMTMSELHALTQEVLPKGLDRKLLSCLREGPDTRPHYRKDAGSTILQPHLLERSSLTDVTDPLLDRETLKLPSDLNGMFYQRKLAQKMEEGESELASYTVHVSEIGMVETELTLRMAYLQNQMLLANHRI